MSQTSHQSEPSASLSSLSRRRFLRASSGAVLLLSTLGTTSASEILPFESDGTAFVGTVVEVVGHGPIAGAQVRAEPGGIIATADADGVFRLAVAPGVYTLTAEAPDHEPLTLQQVTLGRAADTHLAIQLAWLDVPADAPPAPEPPEGRVGALAVALPASIQLCQYPNKSGGQWLPLDEYVKGVVPVEMGTGWPREALRAQAIAARTKAAYMQLALGYTWTTSQAYNPTIRRRGDDTNAAVDDTRGVVMTYQGALFDILYFGCCNGISTKNHRDAIVWNQAGCPPIPNWRPTPVDEATHVAVPCTGHDAYNGADNNCGYFGRGVGMCQTGAKDLGNGGKSYQAILQHYYSGIDFFGIPVPPATPTQLSPGDGALFLPGETINLRWSATGATSYELSLLGREGDPSSTIQPGGQTSYSLTAGGLGVYRWAVKASNAYGETWSPQWRWRVVDRIYRARFPLAFR